MSTAARTLSLPEAAEELGVHYMTAYRYIRQGRLPAERQGSEWRVLHSDVKRLLRGNQAVARRGSARTSADREGLERRMLAGDSAGAWWLVESQLGGGMEPPGVLTELIVPVLEAIGTRWANGEVSVAEEHRATAVALRVIGRLGLQFGRPGKTRGTVVLSAPSGDFHSIPIAVAADLLRWKGFDVLELGSNTPAESLAEMVQQEQRLVAVGVVSTTRGFEKEVAAAAAAVHAVNPGVTVFMGGAAVNSAAQALRLGADVWTGNGPNAAVDTVEAIAGAADEPA